MTGNGFPQTGNGFPQLSIHDMNELFRLGTLIQAWMGEGPRLHDEAMTEIITLSRRYGMEPAELMLMFQRCWHRVPEAQRFAVPGDIHLPQWEQDLLAETPEQQGSTDTVSDAQREDAEMDSKNWDPNELTQRQEPVGQRTGYHPIPHVKQVEDL